MAYDNELNITRLEKEESKDIGNEFVLSDYQPDIRKILLCNETVSLPSIYTDGERIGFDGTVAYRILYLATDNKLYGCSFTGEYSFASDIPSRSAGELSHLVSVYSDGCTARQISPKKISVKTKLKASVMSQGSAEKSECMTERFVPSQCEGLSEKCEFTHFSVCGPSSFELSDEIVTDTESSNLRILYCEASPSVSGITNDKGEITVHGEVVTDLLYCNEEYDEIPKLTRRKIPFSHTVECDVAPKDVCMCARVVCTESDVKFEGTSLLMTIYCCSEIVVNERKNEIICKDIYSPECELSVSKSSITVLNSLVSSCGSLSVNASLPALDVGIDGGSRVVYCTSSALCEHFSYDNESKRASVNGRVKFKILTVNDSTDVWEYDCKETFIPFKYDVMHESLCECDTDMIYSSISAKTARTSFRYDGERIGLDTEVSISVNAYKKSEHNVICDAVIGEKVKKDNGYVKVVYVAPNENLWCVGKRTCTSIQHLCDVNGIKASSVPDDEGSLSGIKYLLL